MTAHFYVSNSRQMRVLPPRDRQVALGSVPRIRLDPVLPPRGEYPFDGTRGLPYAVARRHRRPSPQIAASKSEPHRTVAMVAIGRASAWISPNLMSAKWSKISSSVEHKNNPPMILAGSLSASTQ